LFWVQTRGYGETVQPSLQYLSVQPSALARIVALVVYVQSGCRTCWVFIRADNSHSFAVRYRAKKDLPRTPTT